MHITKWSLILATTVLLAACGGEQPPKETLKVDNAADSLAQTERMKKTKKIFYNIPSPMETAGLMRKAGAKYNSSILNDIKNVDKYTAASKQAINLGVYGADLSYASVFNHTQESMFYTSCAKKLADRLGVSNAFNDSTLEVMQENQNDRDALLDVVSETYWNVDAYLKENDRHNISALMIAGGWVEGLYIGTEITKTNDSPELRQRIAEQKLSLGDLIDLIKSYNIQDPALENVSAELISLQQLFEPVASPGGETSITNDQGVTVVGSKDAPAALTDAQLKAIRDKVAIIRNNFIN